MENKRPQVAVGVYILNKAGQLLISKRIGAHAPGTWCPPGGHLEFGETFLQAAKREAKEEVNVDVAEMETIGITNAFHESEQKQYIVVHLKATKWSGEPKVMEPEKHMDLGWFDLNKLPSPLLLSNQLFFDSNPVCLCRSGKKYRDCHGK